MCIRDSIGVDRVGLAVVDGYRDVDNRISEDATAGHRLEDALLDGRNVLARDGTPHHLVSEDEALAAGQGLEAEMADAELPVPA